MTCWICEKEFEIESYGDGTCPKCGQKYVYDEDYRIVLEDDQYEALYRLKRHQKEFGIYYQDWLKHDRPWELWEIRWVGCLWISMCWDHITYFGREDVDFRRKPETIRIGDYNLRKPITDPTTLVEGQEVWLLEGSAPNGYNSYLFFPCVKWLKSAITNRTLYASEEAVLEWVKWWRETVINKL